MDNKAQNRGLLLVGHGSGENPESGRTAILHAEEIRRRNIFAEVHVGYLKQGPKAGQILDDFTIAEITAVPFMACSGHITNTVLPVELRSGKNINVTLAEPVGTHGDIAGIVGKSIARVMDGRGLPRSETTILLAGHGSSRGTESAERTRELAGQIMALDAGLDVVCAFLEEAPFIKDWNGLTTAKNIIAVPFLVAGGLHGSQDIPALLGIAPPPPSPKRLGDGADAAGPYEIHGRKVWYCRPLGYDPALTRIILERADGK